jgi:tetratricopeptide (TPR) repeat protein
MFTEPADGERYPFIASRRTHMAAATGSARNSVLDEALQLFDTEDYPRIIELLRAPGVQSDPDAIYMLGCALDLSGYAVEALNAFERLVELGDARGPGAIAQHFWTIDRFEDALVWYDRAVEVGDSESELEYSRALLWLERTAAAKAHLRSLLATDDATGDEAAGLLGSVLALEGERSEIVRGLLTRGQELDPDAKGWLGTFALREGNVRVGVSLLESALTAGSAQASVALGNYYAEVGQFDDARHAYQVGVEAGDKFVMFNLGAMLYLEFPRRRAESLRLIRAAADSGDPLAKNWFRSRH